VRLVNGVPLPDVMALDDAGHPVWREPATVLRLWPDGHEEVLASSPPHPSLRPIDPATYAMDHGWRIRLTGGGIHAAPPDRDEPALGDGAYRVVIGAPGEEIGDHLWPALSALFSALLTGIPSRVELVVLGTPTSWGTAAARELAQRHQGPSTTPPADATDASDVSDLSDLSDLVVSPTRPRRRLVLLAAAIAVLLVAGITTFLAWPDRRSAQTSTVTGAAADQPGALGLSAGTSGSVRPSTSRSASTAPSRRPSGSASPPSPGAPSASAPAEVATASTPAGLAGPIDLAAGKATTESSHADVYPSRNVTDGDAMTYWESRNGAFPQWVQVDLGTPADVRRLVLRLPPSSAWPSRTQRIEVQAGTAEGALATVVGAATYGFDAGGGQRVTVALPAGAPRRYVRLVFTANSIQPAGQLSGVELYTT
jgi:hypothetical protein